MGGTPCAACKCLRRKCGDDCVFAPHFPPSNLENFVSIHKVFGASNISKILNEIPPHQREDAVISLVYEAEFLERDSVHGCVGYISFLHQYLTILQHELLRTKQELALYMGSSRPPFIPSQLGNNLPPNFMIPQERPLVIREPNSSQQHQLLQCEQLQRMAGNFFDRGDNQNGMSNGGSGIENNGFVTATGFSHMNDQGPSGLMSGPTFNHDQGPSGSISGPTLVLGSFCDNDVMEKEIEQDHMNNDQGASGSMSAATPASGSFGDNDVMEKEIVQDHMNHDQAYDTDEATRSSTANSGKTVSDAEMGQRISMKKR